MSENLEVLLVSRAAVYRTLQNLLGNEPSDESLAQLVGAPSREVLGLFSFDEGYRQALTTLFSAVTNGLGAPEDTAAFVDTLSCCFTRLFVGPGSLEAAPWESLYVSREGVLFQPSTLEVRKTYVAQGFIPRQYPHVADDHLALELDFMSKLAERSAEAYQTGDYDLAEKNLVASREFLEQHLLVWAPAFVAALRAAPHAGFYGKAGDLLAAWLPVDHRALYEMLETLGESALHQDKALL
jgi:TorA maturation chaperone TorD